MKRALLLMSIFSIAVFAIVGCHKNSLDYGNVGVLNLGLKRDCQFASKAAVESFDARVTIYYSTEDTIGYNCRFLDADGDGLFSNDLAHSESIYVRREVGFWVGVSAVIQGDTLSGMSDPTRLLYLSGENSALDVEIVLSSGYPRIIVNSDLEINGGSILLYGEVIEGTESLEQYAFALKRGQLSEEEKRFWAKRILTESDIQQLDGNDDYLLYDAEPSDNNPNIFVARLYAQELDSAEYSVVALATLRMDDGDSVPTVVHSPVVSMTIPGMNEPISTDPTFVWIREGGEAGAGLDEFGLSWQMNAKAIFAQIIPIGNARLYILESSDYAITDINALEARLVSETEATVYNNVNVESNSTYDDVIATVYNEKTYLIHIPNCIVEVYTSTTITITGTYKMWDGEISGGNTSSYSDPTGYKDGYGYVDLGLPSGLLWAYSNVGASSPIEYGNYYAWGETETKETYDWETYQYCDGSELTQTKYCNDEGFGLNGYTDTLTTLESGDDAASVNWGGNWRMPTLDEMQELVDNCDTTWTSQNGLKGLLFTSRTNGNSIFLPAAGYLYDNDDDGADFNGYYWTSSLDTEYPSFAKFLDFSSGVCNITGTFRNNGFSVRPVCVQSKKKRK